MNYKLIKSVFMLAMLCPFVTQAGIILDRTGFESNLGTIVVDDYENAGYVFIQSDAAMSAVLGETEYSSTGFTDINIVTSGGVSQSSQYCAGCNGSFLLDFTSTSVGDANGVYGVGLDYFNVSTPIYHAYVTFGDSTTLDIALDQTFGGEFFGITSDLSISSIHFGLANGGTTTSGNFRIDNLTVGSSAVAVVSEPGTVALFGLGFLGLALARKRLNRET